MANGQNTEGGTRAVTGPQPEHEVIEQRMDTGQRRREGDKNGDKISHRFHKNPTVIQMNKEDAFRNFFNCLKHHILVKGMMLLEKEERALRRTQAAFMRVKEKAQVEKQELNDRIMEVSALLSRARDSLDPTQGTQLSDSADTHRFWNNPSRPHRRWKLSNLEMDNVAQSCYKREEQFENVMHCEIEALVVV